jgi:NAD(P)-dependent dehydrogenase (short-subunit alcohol dehydrogenase family)
VQRVALITGAGTGLGRATVQVLVEKGYQCGLVGRREHQLRQTSEEVVDPSMVEVVVADVSLQADRARLVEQTLGRFGRLDVLVNNAGISHSAPLLTTSPADWQRVMATNVEAMFFLSQNVIPTMREQGFGRIVNIGSVYGSLGRNAELYASKIPQDTDSGPVRHVAYHASKGGVLNLTRDLAVAVARWGITVNCISPGMFETEQSRAVLDANVVEALTRMTPIGRMGEPREIGYAVAFLASEESAFITGVDLRVDGGWTIW